VFRILIILIHVTYAVCLYKTNLVTYCFEEFIFFRNRPSEIGVHVLQGGTWYAGKYVIIAWATSL
jgi:hypothetical protein